jgi:site-specific recombinase XerD
MSKVMAASVQDGSPHLLDLIPPFRRHLEAENKAPRTREAYTEATRRLHEFLTVQGMPTAVSSITREHLEAFFGDQLDRLKPSSARSRYASLRQFFAYVVDLGEVPSSPMARMHPPKVPEQPVPILTEEHLRALLKAAERETTFYARRDAAIIRLFVDTGGRLAEVSGLEVDDVNLDSGTVRFMGKGRRVRYNPIGSKTLRALDRYLMVRRHHADADKPALWLGRSGPMTSYGIDQAVRRRALEAGIGAVHVHQLRHTAVHFLRVAGADDDSVMRLMGWRDRAMLHRYGSSAADERAHGRVIATLPGSSSASGRRHASAS